MLSVPFVTPPTESALTRLRGAPALPPEPDRTWADDWLHRSHTADWAETDRR